MPELTGSSLQATSEQGGVLVWVALFTPVAILFVALVIDVGHWFDHKRQLQLRADAGALATARAFTTCFTDKDTADSSIYQLAGQYGGAATIYTPNSTQNGPLSPFPGSGLLVPSPIYNTAPAAASPANNTYTLVNSQTFANQSSPVDSGVPATHADPCNAAMADVKITETNLPWYMQALSVPFINAHARVKVETETSGTGFEPFAVANTDPAAVTVYVVNEDVAPSTSPTSGYILDSVNLTDQGADPSAQGELWSNKATPAAISINAPHMGLVIAVSGNPKDTTCGDKEVACFGGAAATWGGYSAGSLVHIQGYSKAGTGSYSSPLARSVTLGSSTCANADSSDAYYSTNAASCTFSITAKLDLGSTPNPAGVTVTPVVAKTPQTTALTYNPGTGLWSGTATLPAGVTSAQVDLKVTCNPNTSGSPCATVKNPPAATISDVQRADAADPATAAGILGADIYESTDTIPLQDSFEICETGNNPCTNNLVFHVTTVPGLKPNGPRYFMNFPFGASSPNQTGILGCASGISAADEYQNIVNGCNGTYAINTSDYPACTNVASSGPSPWDCVPENHGIKEGQFFQALNQRFEPTGTCTNLDHYYTSDYTPTDPRIIHTFIVPYDSVASQTDPIPIQNFAAFYVTGWDDSKDPCSTTGPNANDSAGKDQLVGHFINYVDGTGGSGTGKCVFGALAECVAVLTQ